jgi:hypothetical protein
VFSHPFSNDEDLEGDEMDSDDFSEVELLLARTITREDIWEALCFVDKCGFVEDSASPDSTVIWAEHELFFVEIPSIYTMEKKLFALWSNILIFYVWRWTGKWFLSPALITEESMHFFEEKAEILAADPVISYDALVARNFWATRCHTCLHTSDRPYLE